VCAKMAASPDPPPVVLLPESVVAFPRVFLGEIQRFLYRFTVSKNTQQIHVFFLENVSGSNRTLKIHGPS
jgi:hypothetical protein